MTEKQKQLALIGGTVVLVVLFLLWLAQHKVASANTVIDGSNSQLPTATGIDLGPSYAGNGGPVTYVIPGLDLGGPNLQMIGACCSDCMQSDPFSTSYRPGNTYVFNAPSRAGNTYINETTITQPRSGGLYACPAGMDCEL